MKRLMIAAATLSLLGGSAAVAQPGRHDVGRHEQMDRHDHGGPGFDRGHHWSRGERLPPQYRGRGYYVDWRAHHLRRPPRGYQWERVNDQYVLVALTTGLIAEILANQ